jgi:HEAT repeat protein
MFLAPLAFLLAAQPVLAKPIIRPRPAPAPAPAPILSDEQVLKNADVDADGAALLEFFKKRVTPSLDLERASKLTEQLNDSKEEVHRKAARELIALGPMAVPALRRAINEAPSEESLARARKCLEAIEGSNGTNVVQCAVRLLAARNPQGAADALMDYLPLADDETVVQEVETALMTVGVRDGKPESALVRALSDGVAIRRGLATRVLCKVGGTAGRDAVRPLLKDAKPSVRMQAALSLADAHDAESLPVLIDLLGTLPEQGRRRVEEYLTDLAGEWSVRTPQGNDAMSQRLRRELWTAWWRSLDGKRLLEELQNRTLSDEERARALEALGKLSDASAEVRAKAAENLIAIGPRAASLLRQTLDNSDGKHLDAVRQCLAALERDTNTPMAEVVPRLIALRRPEGAVEAMLAYLPFAENDTLANTIAHLLATTGVRDGKADAALVRALEDKIPARRAAAAIALCQGGADDERPAVQKLLKDPDPIVRLRAALALAQRGEKEAVPALIADLADLPLDRVWEAEEALTTLAGDAGPNERVTADKASRTAAVDAWKTWWKKEEKNVDLAKLNAVERGNGNFLISEMQGNRILEVDRSGRIRWQLQGPQWPWDAVVCRNGNVFSTNSNNNQISMWTKQGKMLWQKNINQPLCCQQLRNGNLFVVGRQGYFEFDVNGKELSSHIHNQGWIVDGIKFPNGHVALMTQQGQYTRFDAAGKQVKSYQVQMNNGVPIYAEILPGDRVVASINTGRVVEYDDKGQSVWDVTVNSPVYPHRLPNGHTLVAQSNLSQMVEIDQKGKVVAEKKLDYRPWRIRRR